ncbi:glycosyl transferase family 2 [Serinibacter arcticus]|uniref:Glycosyl transferase family 2 n=1 Tax=Serinibacter arcticus TaxID=1655435 RepID=A0A2U1ZRK3_9MICO|nr:cellulose synthase catalytic subunit [Serinibacter arcticus]PWD49580.1 glycosyl transferase family 2 [Serinibacter arcticus]
MSPPRHPSAPTPSPDSPSELVVPTPFDRLLERERLRTTDDQADGRRARRRTTSPVESPSLMMLVLLATIGAVAYSVFLLNPANRGDLLPYVLVIAAECLIVLHALLAMWTILSSGYNPRTFAFFQAQRELVDTAEISGLGLEDSPHLWPMRLENEAIDVDVYITVYGEDLGTIERTVRAALAMHGSHTTWVLDDGRSDDVRDLCAELGSRYVRRLSSHGAKAGNVNHALTISSAPYFAIFDADFVPEPEFLHETVPFFTDDRVAFVQTPQTYRNLSSIVSRGAGYMQAVFYRFIQPGRNRFNAAFCVGTNVIFRREAVADIGGMYTDSKSEDVWTSLLLHERGWTSIYIPLALAVGDTPQTIEAYTRQQQRWATGGFEILLRHNPFSRRRTLTFDQRVQYFVTATHYLTGMAPLLLLMVPPMQIYFDLAPMNLTISPGTWVLYYSAFYVMQIAIAFFTLGSFRWQVLLLAAVSFPIYVRAFVGALLGRDTVWHATGARGERSSAFAWMVPQTVVFVFLAITSVVGILKQEATGLFTLALAWNVTNTLIVGSFLLQGAHEDRTFARAARAERALARSAVVAAAPAAPTSVEARGGRDARPATAPVVTATTTPDHPSSVPPAPARRVRETSTTGVR